MNPAPLRSLSRLTARLALGAACVAAVVPAPAGAAPLPNPARKVQLNAREQPVGVFLQNLMSQADVATVVGANVTGSVNGSFSGQVGVVLADLMRAYNLVSYYDGALLHVVPASEVVQRTFPATLEVADKLLREVSELGLQDARNVLRRTADGNLVASGVPRFVEQVAELVRAGQVKKITPPPTAATMEVRVFPLRYASATDTVVTIGGQRRTVEGVATMLRRLMASDHVVTVVAPPPPDVQTTVTVPGLHGKGPISQQTPPASAQKAGGPGTPGADGVIDALQRTALPPPPPAPPAPPVVVARPQPRIEADERINAVIVRDLAEMMPRYAETIAALDLQPQSIEVEATIIDINTDKARELGIDWRIQTRRGEFEVQNNPSAFSMLAPGATMALGLGTLRQFLAKVRALESSGAASVVTRPQIATLNNTDAVFDVGSNAFVRVPGVNQVDLFPINAGTMLRVRPRVIPDGGRTQIKMSVAIEDGKFSEREVDRIPVVERSTLTSELLVAEGESMLLGGMVREVEAKGEDKVPVVGDVPLVGNLFKRSTSSVSRIERIVLITPRLAGSRPAPSNTGVAPLAPTAPVGPAPRPSRVIDLEAMPAAAPAQRVPAAGGAGDGRPRVIQLGLNR